MTFADYNFTDIPSFMGGVETNLGIPLEVVFVMTVNLGCLLFFAKSFKLGASMMFLLNTATFIMFVIWDWNTALALSTMLISIVVLALSVFMAKEKLPGGFA